MHDKRAGFSSAFLFIICVQGSLDVFCDTCSNMNDFPSWYRYFEEQVFSSSARFERPSSRQGSACAVLVCGFTARNQLWPGHQLSAGIRPQIAVPTAWYCVFSSSLLWMRALFKTIASSVLAPKPAPRQSRQPRRLDLENHMAGKFPHSSAKVDWFSSRNNASSYPPVRFGRTPAHFARVVILFGRPASSCASIFSCKCRNLSPHGAALDILVSTCMLNCLTLPRKLLKTMTSLHG
jgi:hypothetical protein